MVTQNRPTPEQEAPDSGQAPDSRVLVENFFRHEYGRLVAVLTRVLGAANLDVIEDVVQSALVDALRSWSLRGIPEDPGAWLFRVAKNHALDALRRQRNWERVQPELVSPGDGSTSLLDELHFATEIGDEPLRMLFVCCHPELQVESRIALALRVLCGFSPGEVARALLTTESNVQKRIFRAKEIFRKHHTTLEPLSTASILPRLPAVHLVLYLMFNEGYHATDSETLIRADLCSEAMRLTLLLAEHPQCTTPATAALMALMYLHAARFDGRFNDRDELLLLAEQDRNLWNQSLIRAGMAWLDRSAQGDELTRYHLEAAISAEHCKAKHFAATNWERIVHFYDLLIQIEPSPLQHLNRSVALAEWKGPAEGLIALDSLPKETIPENYHLWPAIRGELLRRLNRLTEAEPHFAKALRLSKSTVERKLLSKRWEECTNARPDIKSSSSRVS